MVKANLKSRPCNAQHHFIIYLKACKQQFVWQGLLARIKGAAMSRCRNRDNREAPGHRRPQAASAFRTTKRSLDQTSFKANNSIPGPQPSPTLLPKHQPHSSACYTAHAAAILNAVPQVSTPQLSMLHCSGNSHPDQVTGNEQTRQSAPRSTPPQGWGLHPPAWPEPRCAPSSPQFAAQPGSTGAAPTVSLSAAPCPVQTDSKLLAHELMSPRRHRIKQACSLNCLQRPSLSERGQWGGK